MRFNATSVNIQQPVPADDASAGFPHRFARREQLRERIGEVFAAPAFQKEANASMQRAYLTRHRFCTLSYPAANPTVHQSPTTTSSLHLMEDDKG